YGARTRPSEGVLQKIYVKCLVLEAADGSLSAMVTSDLLGFPRDVSDEIFRACLEKHKLPRERVILNSSHTHSGPVVGRMLRPAYPAFTKQQEEAISRYTAELVKRVVATVGDALKERRPAVLAFDQGLAGFGVNRRRVRLRNLPGPVDHDVPVLSVREPSGRLRAILFGYACHNTALGDYRINGDWAGFAQHELEERYPGAIALFVEGCGADINPLPRYQGPDSELLPYVLELPRMYGSILAAAVAITLAGSMKPVAGPLNAGHSVVDLPFHNVPTRQELERRLEDKSEANVYGRRHAELMLSILRRDGKLPDRYPYPVQVWRFGKDLSLVALAGEVVVDYSLRLKAQYGWTTTWVAGYCNDVFAYIPSLRVLNEGGYEGGGAMLVYGQPSAFGAAVEEIIIEQVNDLMKETQAI
ncbi:MAG: neutral/alkaline non-lysosomal ceramidase N-terminal domain-containing protein, partial [Bryobacteraceae bacterium]